jgi:hypothetical protein
MSLRSDLASDVEKLTSIQEAMLSASLSNMQHALEQHHRETVDATNIRPIKEHIEEQLHSAEVREAETQQELASQLNGFLQETRAELKHSQEVSMETISKVCGDVRELERRSLAELDRVSSSQNLLSQALAAHMKATEASWQQSIDKLGSELTAQFEGQLSLYHQRIQASESDVREFQEAADQG